MKYVLFVARGDKYNDDGEDHDDNDGVDTVMINIWPARPLVAFSSNRKQLQCCNLRKKKRKKNTTVRYSEYVHVHT